MRLLRFVITSLAVIAGLLGAFALLAIGFVVYVLARLFGRPATMPRFQGTGRTSAARPAQPAPAARGDVIDVVATDVKD